MNRNNLPTFKILGTTCNVLSFFLTIIMCLPLPIVIFFVKNRMTSIFSIYNRYTEYLEGILELNKLNQKLKNTRIGLYIFAFIWVLITILVFVNTDISKFDNVIGNSIVILPIVLITPCVILCNKVRGCLHNKTD